MIINPEEVQAQFVRKVNFLRERQQKQLETQLSSLSLEHRSRLGSLDRNRQRFLDRYAQHLLTPFLLEGSTDNSADEHMETQESEDSEMFPMTHLKTARSFLPAMSRKNRFSVRTQRPQVQNSSATESVHVVSKKNVFQIKYLYQYLGNFSKFKNLEIFPRYW